MSVLLFHDEKSITLGEIFSFQALLNFIILNISKSHIEINLTAQIIKISWVQFLHMSDKDVPFASSEVHLAHWASNPMTICMSSCMTFCPITIIKKLITRSAFPTLGNTPQESVCSCTCPCDYMDLKVLSDFETTLT